MGLQVVSTAMLLASCISAAPLISRATNETSFYTDPTGYMKGFRDPTIESSVGGQAICVSGIVDVTASGINQQLMLQEPANQTAVTNLLLENIQIDSPLPKQVIGDNVTISGTYGIYSQLCFPNGEINSTTIQFLTHGLGIDRSYWNNAPNYSYVDYAAEQGYTTFLYDRLGVGLSDHPDPIQVVQEGLQVAIAHELIQLLRTSRISDHTFEHVVGVGHSFGSSQTLGISAQYPEDFDAVVLTGYSTSTTGMLPAFSAADLTIASQAVPLRFADLPNGYLTSNNIIGAQFFFFRAPYFDPALLDLVESTKQSVTLGEYFATGSFFQIAANFTGPVDFVIGEHDLPNCNSNCYLPNNLAEAAIPVFYPNATKGSSSFIAPGAGHFWNYHYSATAAFEHIHDFIRSNGF